MLEMAAHIANRLGRLDEAAKGYRELLRLGDQNWMTPVELAGVLRRQGRNDEAMKEIDKLKAAKPEIAKMIDSYFADL
jgi:predicted Zn-dependent protease